MTKLHLLRKFSIVIPDKFIIINPVIRSGFLLFFRVGINQLSHLTEELFSKMYKAIFWDNDGVLVDTEKYYFEATRRVFKNNGLVLSKEIFVENFLKNSKGAWFILSEKGFPEKRIQDLRKERNIIYQKLLEENDLLIDGVKEVLEKLSTKYMMAIVTSSQREHFETIHKKTGVLKYFDFYLTREDYTNSKPDPEPYRKALNCSGLKSSEVVVIEDSERGLKSALSAGINCIIIPSSLTQKSNFFGAEKVLNNVCDILDYL